MNELISGAAHLGISLSNSQIASFEAFYRELGDWNTRVNLTSITGYEDVQVKHFLDSLTVILAIPEIASGKSIKVLDVGSGAGLPGIPLRIIYPQLDVTLLEATGKKTTFLSHLIQVLNLPDVLVVNGRAEDMAHRSDFREKYDIVLCRAVAPLPTLAELTLPFCTIGGKVVAQKKGDIQAEFSSSERAVKSMGGEIDKVIEIEMDEFPDNRQLIVLKKRSATPAEYPRRPGIPDKSPLI